MTIDKLIRSKRKSISIQISSFGEVVVRAPNNCSYEKIEKVVTQKSQWIELHKQKILQNKLLNSDIVSYKKILFLGYTKNVVFADNLKKWQ